jgi:uncharacterized protein
MQWSEFETQISELVEKIDCPIDVIVGVVRGGIVPARCLAAKLGVKEMYCLNVHKQGNNRTVVTSINPNLKDKTVLLVEDVLESGKSLAVAANYLAGEKLALVKTVSLYYMPETEVTPDFTLGQVVSVPRFPWEK